MKNLKFLILPFLLLFLWSESVLAVPFTDADIMLNGAEFSDGTDSRWNQTGNSAVSYGSNRVIEYTVELEAELFLLLGLL